MLEDMFRKHFPLLICLGLVLGLAGFLALRAGGSVSAAHASGVVSTQKQVAAPTERTVTIANTMSQTIWVAEIGSPSSLDGGWRLDPGATKVLTLPNNWGGRIWGRTGCNFDATGHGTCDTGDCARVLQCTLSGATPASLAEFKFSAYSGLDFYDVSLVDGYNLPMRIDAVSGTPSSGNPKNCLSMSCYTDLNTSCPGQLQVKNGAGKVVACMNSCAAFNTDQDCCRGAFSGQNCKPSEWMPVSSATVFKKAYPYAYSYSADDATSTFTSRNSNYLVTFGPPTNVPSSLINGSITGAPGTLSRSGWTATASSIPPVGSCCASDVPAKALDNNTSTRWSTGQAQTAGQWFEVDMQASQKFSQITLNAAGSTHDYIRGYKVLVSQDGNTWTSVATGVGTSALVKISFTKQTARYIKVVTTKNAPSFWWSIAEFNVIA